MNAKSHAPLASNMAYISPASAGPPIAAVWKAVVCHEDAAGISSRGIIAGSNANEEGIIKLRAMPVAKIAVNIKGSNICVETGIIPPAKISRIKNMKLIAARHKVNILLGWFISTRCPA